MKIININSSHMFDLFSNDSCVIEGIRFNFDNISECLKHIGSFRRTKSMEHLYDNSYEVGILQDDMTIKMFKLINE